jgi:hypothetical protein
MSEPGESVVLVTFEQRNIPDYYLEYYKNKRHNFFATLQQFPRIWNCYISLDRIWQREFELMRELRDPSLLFPMTLYMTGHAKMRIAFELGCSACLAEAHSILRDAIEAVAHGHRLGRNPNLAEIWLRKDEDATTLKAYKQEFEERKADNLFKDLGELHALWKRFSKFGSHTNLNSIAERFGIETTATHLEFKCNYTGSRPEILAPALFEMIHVSHLMESALFRVCEDRLKLDLGIPKLRQDFEQEKETVRRWVITSWNLKRPQR